MVEGLKILVGMLGDVTGLAAWLVGAFVVYKLIIYLSGVGAVVLLTRLAIERLYGWLTHPKADDPVVIRFNLDDICISIDGTAEKLRGLLKSRIRTSKYLHGCDVDDIASALHEWDERHKEKED